MAGRWLLSHLMMTSLLGFAAATDNCNPRHALPASQCTAQHTATTEYRMLDSLLVLSVNSDDPPAQGFLWNATLEAYQFLHPCLSNAEAALELFYGLTKDLVDPTWMANMDQLILAASPYQSRRRDVPGHAFGPEERVVMKLLANMVEATNTGCVQKLIEDYKDAAAVAFKRSVPTFVEPAGSAHAHTTHPHTTTPKPTTHRPHTTTPKPTTHRPHTTTPKPTTHPHTTTPKPTTHPHTTTPKPTTTKPTTTPKPTTPKPTTTKPTTTTTATPTTPSRQAPLVCSVCSEIQCLIPPYTTVSCPSVDHLCYIEVEHTTTTSNTIKRGCILESECATIHNRNCHDLETETAQTNLYCKFCCNIDGCNIPPHLMPIDGTIYPQNPGKLDG